MTTPKSPSYDHLPEAARFIFDMINDSIADAEVIAVVEPDGSSEDRPRNVVPFRRPKKQRR